MLRILQTEHQQVEDLLADVLAYLTSVEQIEPQVIGRYRFHFDRWLKRHLEFLGGTIGPALRAEGSGEAIIVERRLTAATLDLWALQAAHAARFPITSDTHDWAAFRMSADHVVANVVELIGFARAELYPVLEQHDLNPLARPAQRHAAG